MEEHESFARTVAFLRRGDSFGVGQSGCESRLLSYLQGFNRHSFHDFGESGIPLRLLNSQIKGISGKKMFLHTITFQHSLYIKIFTFPTLRVLRGSHPIYANPVLLVSSPVFRRCLTES